ncbi:MAG: ATPase [Sphingomonadales bacterium]|nr:ATPase [Sphingomonadales bacterium]
MAAEPRFSTIDPKDPPVDPLIGTPFGGAPVDDWQPVSLGREEPAAGTRLRDWVIPVLALAALAGWTGFFIWANFAAMRAISDPGIWTGWASNWAAPAVVIGIAWLIAMRSSRREAGRFLNAARRLADENERLETRITAINRELSLAREFVTAQARDLDAVGRITVERLSQHGERMQALIRENGEEVETIAAVSARALDNMERLRGQLPVLTTAAKDVANNFGLAGRTAQAQLTELEQGFARLTASAERSQEQVSELHGTIDRGLDTLAARSDTLGSDMAARLAAIESEAQRLDARLQDERTTFYGGLRARTSALDAEIAATRERFERDEAESLAALRTRLLALREECGALAHALAEGEAAAQARWHDAVGRIDADLRRLSELAESTGDKAAATSRGRMAALAEEAAALERVLSETAARFDIETTRRRHGSEAADRAMIERLEGEFARIDQTLAASEARHGAHFDQLADRGQAMLGELGAIETRIAGIASTSAAADGAMRQQLGALAARLGESRGELDATEIALAGLTDNAVRLLEIIQAGSAHSRGDLARAIDTGAARLGEIETRVQALRDGLGAIDRSGAALSTLVGDVQERMRAASDGLHRWHAEFDRTTEGHGRKLDELAQALADLDRANGAAAARAETVLANAIRQLREQAGAAIVAIEQRGAGAIAGLTAQLGEASGEAIERAMRLQVTEITGKLEQAATHAAGVGRKATGELRGELARVEELLGALETRVDAARNRAEEQVDNGFGRRVALITEALNSNAIDIAKALNAEVSDTAWAAYLRGDRGIFTRRAVRLLDAPEARGIAQLYEADPGFRDHTSRYIHDFEAMLRQLLSTRDGHALGVTLLSSDMGKLYVALAQGIERLRN